MSEECIFTVCIRDIRATELTTRNRFKDRLKIKIDFDGKKFKSRKELIGGGDVTWNFTQHFEYKIFSWTMLEEKEILLRAMLSKTECYGSVRVNLHTLATGPMEHNLPLLNGCQKVVGRLNFVVEMEHVTNVAVCFREIQLRHLKPLNGKECNPYLKYAYSMDWSAVAEGYARAYYSTVIYNTTDPKWTDLPELRFKAPLREILKESIVVHVTHHGKLTNTTLGRCNLLFRTLVDNGKTFKDEDLISFKGPLKVDNAEIQGTLIFKFLPRFAQMKPVNILRKAIHTEKGIFDAVPLIHGLPQPHCPIIMTQDAPSDITKVLTCSTSKLPEKPVHFANILYLIGQLKKKEKTKSSKSDPSELKEPEPMRARSSTVSYEASTKLPALDKPTLRKKADLSETLTSTTQRDLIAFSPITARKIQSASNLRELSISHDPYREFLTTNPFSTAPDAITPTFNPFQDMMTINSVR